MIQKTPFKTSTALTLVLLLGCYPALAAPEGGQVVGGSASIQQAGKKTTVTQSTDRGIINWNSFDVKTDEAVRFVQPGRNSITVNRIHDTKASKIDGSITANGNIMLLNQHGILFGSGARVDVGGLVASTSDISNPDAFMAGADARLTKPGAADASIINKGRITISEAGLAGFVAPHVKNEGLIQARLGKIQMAGADMTTVDLAGDGLINIAISDETLSRSVTNTGAINADGGRVIITAATARGLVDSLIDNQGAIQANTVDNARGAVEITGEGALFKNTGTIKAEGAGSDKGGSINIDADFAALGGTISTDGGTGGDVAVRARLTLSQAGKLSARGTQAKGGTINIASDGDTWETTTSESDVSGKTDGGKITTITAHNLTSSGSYKATGDTGNGGQIDMTAGSVKLLSVKVNANGHKNGGQIRIGGEYQGGKHLPEGVDELKNAQITTLDSGTSVTAESTGDHGKGGTVIVWSDNDTMALGTIKARPGYLSGDGGFVELSSADILNYGATIETGRGTRQGSVLLDPKNIIIAEDAFDPNYILMGRGYVDPNVNIDEFSPRESFGVRSISLSGNAMAVGIDNATSIGGALPVRGAVYLYSFTDAAFSGGKLEGIIGHGYTGGKNIDTSSYAGAYFGSSVSLDGDRLAVGSFMGTNGGVFLYKFSDTQFTDGTMMARIGRGYTGGNNFNTIPHMQDNNFGYSVGLDGNRLAVGASGDRGINNNYTAGAVYLFTFDDSDFSNPALQGRIGYGYTGANNYNLDTLDVGDIFGRSLSLDGRYLAVSANLGAGADNGIYQAGEAYLFTFSDDIFSTPTLLSRIGIGYNGEHDLSVDSSSDDQFGSSIGLDNGRLLIGALFGDGLNNTSGSSGEIYLISFNPDNFDGLTLEGMLGNNYDTLGGKNYSRPNEADSGHRFGSGLAIDGDRFIVGASYDDGPAGFLNPGQGAVHFYTMDSLFENITHNGTLGYGYTGGKNITFHYDTSPKHIDNRIDISLSGTNLAIGLTKDAGMIGTKGSAGAVYLYQFADTDFSAITLSGIIGDGYTGGNNIDMSAYLDGGDYFGYSVSLDGRHLAVGALQDNGAGNVLENSGGVYLFNFDDLNFTNGTLASRIGYNYASLGAENYSVVLNGFDRFGSSVSLDGNRLVVGARDDDGFNNARSNSGAAYLFTFSDEFFSAPDLKGIIGYGYNGAGDYSISTLDSSDHLGYDAVSLDGNRLAISARGGDGFSNNVSNAGEVYLFTFSDSLFSDPDLAATIGTGYTGPKDIDLPLSLNDALSGLALSGNTLVVGARSDKGVGNTINNGRGAAYVINFSDAAFNGGTLSATIGYGYTGGKNINTAGFNSTWENFGSSITLDQGNLIISSIGSGFNNHFQNSGELTLFRGNASGNIDDAIFTINNSSQLGLTPAAISSLLSTPQNVTLQANNDIFLENDLIVNNPAGSGGTLTLQAGRSIILNASIISDNGNINLLANEKLATGVVNNQRDEGKAVIAMGAGTYIDAGTGQVFIRLDDGAGKTHRGAGDITLTGISAGSILVEGHTPTSSIVLNGTLSAVDAVDAAIILAAGKDLINNTGSGALDTPNSRWLAYTDSPKLDKLNGLSPHFFEYHCAYGGACVPQAGNGIFHEYGANLLSITVNTSRYYGMSNPTEADLLSLLEFIGFDEGHDVSVLDLLPNITIAASANNMADAGTTHQIILSGGSDSYYEQYFFGESLLTIDKKPVTATWNGPVTKTFGSANPYLIVGSQFTYDGFENGQGANVLINPTISWNGVGNGTSVGTYDIFANLEAQNYSFIVDPGQMIITPKQLTATWRQDHTRIYGDANPGIDYTDFTFAGGFVGTDNASIFSVTPDWNGVDATTGVGSYLIGASFNAGNYVVTNTPTANLVITKRDITATVGNATRQYGDSNPALDGTNVTWNNLVNGDTFSNFNSFNFDFNGANATSNAGSIFNIGLAGFDADNYNLTTVTDGTLNITKRDITATVDNATRQYGDSNPAFDGTNVTWNNLANGDTFSDFNSFNFDFNGASATSNAGSTFNIGLTGFDADNYSLTTVTDGTLSIAKRDITATIDDATRQYGDNNPTFDGTNVTWGNLVNGDTFADFNSFNFDFNGASATSGAGSTYAIGLTGFDADNYNLAIITDGTLSIIKRDITATVDDASRQYGDANPNFTGSNVAWGNLANGDTFADFNNFGFDFSGADATSGAGSSYAIGLTGFDADNYSLTTVTDGTLSITKRDITATVDNATRQYGDSNPAFDGTNVTWNNLVNGDTFADFNNFGFDFNGADVTSGAGSSYAISLSGFDADNYSLTTVTDGTLSITKRDITATVDDASRQYGDANPDFTGANVTWGNLANGDTFADFNNFDFDFNGASAASGAGSSYAIGLSGFDADNYTLTTITDGTLSITKRDITATVDNASRQYGDANPDFTGANVTWGNLANGDTFADFNNFDFDFNGADATSGAGSTYAIGLSGFDADNYSLTTVSDGTLSITKRNITATVDNAARAYGDANPAFDGTNVTWSNLVNGDTFADFNSFDFDFDGANATSGAGSTFDINLTAFDADNYTLDISDLTNGILTINKRDITATVDDPTRQYGDSNPVFDGTNVTWSNLANGDTFADFNNFGFNFNGANATSNAGSTFNIGLTGFDADNYNLTTVADGTLSITKRDITATVDDASRQYGDANPNFTGSNVTWSNLANGDTFADFNNFGFDFNGADATSGAGSTYAIGLTGFDADNYSLTTVTDGTLSITKRDITATVNDATRQYGDSNPAFDGTNVTWNNLANGDTFADFNNFGFDFNGASATSGAGSSYAIGLTGFDADNYNLTAVTDGTLSIIKRDITATVDDATRQYGDSNPAFDGTNVTWNNLANGDTFADFNNFDFDFNGADASSNAGSTYAIGLSDFDADNYNLTTITDGTLSITKRDITATLKDMERYYGDGGLPFTYNDVIWHNMANGQDSAVFDVMNITSTATNTSHAGTTHAITISAFDDNNYNLVLVNDGNLTITKAPLSLQVQDATREASSPNPPFTYTLSGLRNGDGANVVSGVSISANAHQNSPAGTYAIVATGGLAQNYIITNYINGTLTVTPMTQLPPTIIHPLRPSSPAYTPDKEEEIKHALSLLHNKNAGEAGRWGIIADGDAPVHNPDSPLISITERLLAYFRTGNIQPDITYSPVSLNTQPGS